MSWIEERKGRACWVACYKINGKKVVKSTGVPLQQAGKSSKQLKQAAEAVALAMEQAATGESTLDKMTDAVRGAAELSGLAPKVPSVREYFQTVPRYGACSTENSRKRSLSLFLEYLGPDADRRIDKVTPRQCQDFVRHELKHMSRKTVIQYRSYVFNAFKRAVELDGLMRINPMASVSVPKEAKLVNPDRGNDVQTRLPFTQEETLFLLRELPEPWFNLMSLCIYTGGLRIRDLCQMRWDNIDLEAGVISLTEQKTKAVRSIRMISRLKDLLTKMKSVADEDEPYLFPRWAQYARTGAIGQVSTQFTSMLKGYGIIPADLPKAEGRRHNISSKSFHSLRHCAETYLSMNPRISLELVRQTVGHANEKVARQYRHAVPGLQANALDYLADVVEGKIPLESPGAEFVAEALETEAPFSRCRRA